MALIGGIGVVLIDFANGVVADTMFSGCTPDAREDLIFDHGLGQGFIGVPLPRRYTSDGDLWCAVRDHLQAMRGRGATPDFVALDAAAFQHYFEYWNEMGESMRLTVPEVIDLRRLLAIQRNCRGRWSSTWRRSYPSTAAFTPKQIR